METMNTVTISVDEYFELRQKAAMNEFLMERLGTLNGSIEDLRQKYWSLESDIKFLISKVGK